MSFPGKQQRGNSDVFGSRWASRRSLPASVATIIAAICLISCLSACGSTASTETSGSGGTPTSNGTSSQTQQVPTTVIDEALGHCVTLGKRGYSVQSADDGIFYLQYAYTLSNTATATALEYPTVRITAYDANGKTLGYRNSILYELLPGQTLANADQILLSASNVARVEFKLTSGQDHWVSATKTQTNGLKALKTQCVKVVKGKDGITVKGEVKNPNAQKVDSAAVTALFYSKSGQVVGGVTTYLDGLKGDSATAFKMTSSYNPKGYKSFKIYVSPWSAA